MDWWILASTRFGLFGYNVENQQFLEGFVLAEQSPLINNGQRLTVLDFAGLPVGHYYLYFGADLVPNGALDTAFRYQQLVLNIISHHFTRLFRLKLFLRV